MRKILNDPERFVDEVMAGIFAAHGQQVRPVTPDHRTLVRADAPLAGKVGIVTGGGSGHLPFFLGYVGQGLCSAVAIGNVFSSPSVEQIHAASAAVDGGAGLLYLYGNYGGDVYNFDLAGDLCRADGIEVATVLGTDDVASAPADQADTRRGVAGLVLTYKAAGAAAERGWSLAEVARVAQHAVDRTRTMGVGLSPTILPAAGEPTFTLDEGEMELGIGIHGERGIERRPLQGADQIVDAFLERIGAELPLAEGQRYAVLVNGLGATPLEELYVVYRRVHEVLTERGVTVVHPYVGEYVTSLEMSGVSVSLLHLDEELEDLLGDPASSPFLRTLQGTGPADTDHGTASGTRQENTAPVTGTGTPNPLRADLLRVLPGLPQYADELRDLDAAVGDGDLGVTVSTGAQAVVEAIGQLPEDVATQDLLRTAALAFATANPSTFAALVAAGTLAVAERAAVDRGPSAAEALRCFADRVSEREGAQRGDKTFLDVVHAVADALADGQDRDLGSVAARAVADGAGLQARRGRAAWQGERTVGHQDPGSVAVLRLVQEWDVPAPPGR